MNYNEYREAVYYDTIEWIKDAGYIEDFKDPEYDWGQRQFDELMEDCELCVTGNDNGSYYCNSYKAREALRDAVFDEDIHSLLSAHGYEDSFWRYIQENDPEGADVIVRCCMFWEIWEDVQSWLENEIGRGLEDY